MKILLWIIAFSVILYVIQSVFSAIGVFMRTLPGFFVVYSCAIAIIVFFIGKLSMWIYMMRNEETFLGVLANVIEPKSLKDHYETWDKFIPILETMSKYQIFLPKRYCMPQRPSELLNKVLSVEDDLPRIAIHNMYDTYMESVKKTGVSFSDTFAKEVDPYKQLLTDICKAEFDLLFARLKLYEKIVGTIAEVDGMDGHTFEYWCADLLKMNGFTDVEVTKGSGDQGVDIVAVKEGIRYAVQCKCYSSDLGNTPVQEVHAGKAMYKCQVGVVMTNRHFTSGAKELAEVTGVLLWDRDKLEEMLGA